MEREGDTRSVLVAFTETQLHIIHALLMTIPHGPIGHSRSQVAKAIEQCRVALLLLERDQNHAH